MYNLFKKEIKHFLGSLIGYLAILIFLLTSGLFLWVFPGNYNIPENGYATLENFFTLAPWLYLFLVPAITMRLFAEENRSGTIEILLTRPLSNFQIVFGKYLAAITLVGFTLLPALIYFISVYYLGNPIGNIDTGATWGAFLGLFFLASIYVAIGLFASGLSDNQIISFILAMVLSFVFFLGFEFIGGSGIPYFLEKILTWFSINEHYLSISRGVVDLRDVIYFAGITTVFLMLAMLVLRRENLGLLRFRKLFTLLVLSVFVLFLLSDFLRIRFDLTAEKRYSLSPVTYRIIADISEPIVVELFLDGELLPGFRKLQQAVIDKVNDLNAFASKPIRIAITDPYKVTSTDKRNAFFTELAQKGVRPTEVRQKTEQGVTTRLVFPGAIIQQGSTQAGISFLKNNPGFSSEINLNHSIENIEYELVAAIKKLNSAKKPNLVFLQGHEELNSWEVNDLSSTLSENFEINFITAQQLLIAENQPKVILIANPKIPFSESDKFAVDQALMKGSRLMWLIDPVEVSLDSLSRGLMTLAFPKDLNLADQLFHYGVRLNSDLVQDVACAQILVNTALEGNRPNFTPQPWYYSPLLTPADDQPFSRNLNLVYSEFVSSIDTVGGAGEISKTVILSSSPYGRIVNTPAAVSLESINRPPARELFNLPHIPTGILLEGRFTSVFRNRMLNRLGISAAQVISESTATKMMIFADGNMVANKVRYGSGANPEVLPLGYDRVSLQTFGNKEYFVNAIQYLADEDGIMQLRNRTVKLRLLDKVKFREGKAYWVWANVALPVVLILVFGLIYNWLRRKKYAKFK